MYNNLKAEMARKGILQKEIAETIQITPRAASFKMTGQISFTLDEAFKIMETHFPEVDIEYLFEKEGQAMTLEDIENMEDDWLTPAQIGPYLKAHPQTIRMAAQHKPELLGFPVTVIGSRVRIPRLPFIKYCRGEYETK